MIELYGSGKAFARTLEMMNVEVDLVQTETEIVILMCRSKRAPDLLHIYIKIYIGKAYSGNALFCQMTHQTMA